MTEKTDNPTKDKDAPKADAKATAPQSDDNTPLALRKDIVPPQYRKEYQANGGNCGDFIASELSAMVESGGLESLNSVKAENNIPAAKWSGLNNGQQRMNLSNTLRASFLRGEDIKIAGKVYNLKALMEEHGQFNVEDTARANKFLEFVGMPAKDRNRKALVRVFKTDPEKALNAAKRIEEREAKAKEREEAKAKKAAEKKAADEAKQKVEQEAAKQKQAEKADKAAAKSEKKTEKADA